MIRARIEHQHFKKLVGGEEVEVPGRDGNGPLTVQLILEDIGWAQMLMAIDRAMSGKLLNNPMTDDFDE